MWSALDFDSFEFQFSQEELAYLYIRCVMVIVHVQRFFRLFSGRLDPFYEICASCQWKAVGDCLIYSSMPGRTNVVIFHAGKNDVK